MVNIILFVQVDFQYILDAMDLSENGTKSYGKYIIIEAEKEGDVRKLVQDDIVAAYCNNKYYVKPGIKRPRTDEMSTVFFVVIDEDQ